MCKLSYLGQFAVQIIENWQVNSSKENTPMAIKHFVAMATNSFPRPIHLISIHKWFSAQQTLYKATNSLLAITFICLLDHIYQAPFANMKIEHKGRPEMPLILRRSGTQYVAMGIKLLSSNCRAHLVESYCKESNISDTNWLRYLFASYLIKTSAQKEIFENSKQHFSSHAGYLFMS